MGCSVGDTDGFCVGAAVVGLWVGSLFDGLCVGVDVIGFLVGYFMEILRKSI